jgi:hypothetical protein
MALSATVTAAAPQRRAGRVPAAPKPARKAVQTPVEARLSLDEARVAVAILDDAYHLLLEEVHDTYTAKPGRPVAATVVRDLQKRMGDLGWPKSRFLAVNAIVMNPDHVARDDFERETVKTLKDTARRIETVEHGSLRIATPVSLGGSCFSCHWADRGRASRAAITWKVPIRD